ncbi:MAG: hypothetical protein K9W43_02670 [Candidatus Thorarchaeota archaeon]|nr:hypothetical protein [Candidatus Thorarchaeota archaeon]
MVSQIQSILRDILCASVSLDDGLSALQSIARDHPEEVELAYEVARAIEEILLRRPSLASTKLTELTVRLSFDERRDLPKMLMLLETRYTNSFRRNEAELLPDVQAIPNLLDILSELSQSMGTALEINLRPLLPFLSDETLLTLDAIYTRKHEASTLVAVHEVHYLTALLLDAGMFECAEALLNQLLIIAREMNLSDFEFELTLDEAAVLTELGMYDECRRLLNPQIEAATAADNHEHLAALMLQLSINETRDDTIPYMTARALGDRAIALYSDAVDKSLLSIEQLGAAYVTIASNILSTGWREGVDEAITRYKSALEVVEAIEPRTLDQSLLLFKTLAGIGFAYGLLGDYDSIHRAIDYLNQASSLLNETDVRDRDSRVERAWCNATIGWICLTSESDEFWDQGTKALKNALSMREDLLKEDLVNSLDIISCKVGLGLSLLRTNEAIDDTTLALLRDALLQYIPLLFTDQRAMVETSITIYDIMWMTHRHEVAIPSRLLGLLEEVMKMLDVTQVHDGETFVVGAKMVVPYLQRSWETLQRVAQETIQSGHQLHDVAHLLSALSTSKMNHDVLNSGIPVALHNPVTDAVIAADPILAQYWKGQFSLADALHSFYTNKDYPTLAEKLYRAATELRAVDSVECEFDESVEFIKATAVTLSIVLFRFTRALQGRYAMTVNVTDDDILIGTDFTEPFSFMLTQDWLGLVKITTAYLQMVEREDVKTHPYLNAVFSNISRSIRMMDRVALVERRILTFLGSEMNQRYYLRR